MATWRESSTPGGYAERRYRRGLRSWRRRTRKYLLLFFGPFALVGLIGLLVERHYFAWLAGAFFGMGAAAWIAIREAPPAHIENWQTGAEGEQKTARALRNLDSSRWLQRHDIENGRGNYDHILASRAGVFLLDSKYPRGEAYIRDGSLWIRRRDDPEADAPCRWIRNSALAGAARLNAQLRELTGRRAWVQSVVVLWCPFEEGLYEDDKCVYVHGSRLADWLDARPDTVDAHAVAEGRAAVQQLAAPSRREAP